MRLVGCRTVNEIVCRSDARVAARNREMKKEEEGRGAAQVTSGGVDGKNEEVQRRAKKSIHASS